jgi:hypothetical protein
MAARKANGGAEQPRQVRKSLMVDEAKLEKARKLLGAKNDADALRMALDHLLSHAPAGHGEEE